MRFPAYRISLSNPLADLALDQELCVMAYVMKYKFNEVRDMDNKNIFRVLCFTVKNWKISREIITFEQNFIGQFEKLEANYINIYASNLQKSNYLVIFQGRNYITIDTKNGIISGLLSLPSKTMTFFRNYGDELVLLNSDFYKGEAVVPFNMHKFDS